MRLVRVDDHVFADGASAQQHSILHVVAVCQCDLNRPTAITDADVGLDDVAQLALAVGTRDFAAVGDFCRAQHLNFRSIGYRMNFEAHMRILVATERLNRIGVQRRCSGACVDLSDDGGDFQVGQRNPFFPA